MTGAPDNDTTSQDGFLKKRGRPSSLAPATTLAVLRRDRGLTLKDLERRTGISVSIWSQLERGLMVPQPRHLAALGSGRVLLDVEPYIVGKREQVRILLALRASIEVPRQKGVWYQATRVPPNETAWREQLKLAVNALNTRGSGEPPAEQSHALAVVRGTLALEAQG